MTADRLTHTRQGSSIVAALEAAYGDLRAELPELPAVTIITGTGTLGRQSVHGYLAPERWHAGGETRQAELLMAGESLNRGAADVFTTLAHEAAHALAHERGIVDTSRGNRYHNRRFVAVAGEFDLMWPTGAKPHGTIGYSAVVLSDDGHRRWASTINRLAADLDAWRTPELGGAGGGTKRTPPTRLVCECQPARILRTSAATAADGGIWCHWCEQEFRITESGD